jgi:ubiquinone/menaquinone biosynthesis C-methylase UbiE
MSGPSSRSVLDAAGCDDVAMRQARREHVPASEADEATRIRSVYAKWDGRHQRSGPIQEASRRLGAERLELTRRLLVRLLPEQYPMLLDVGCGSGGDLSHLRSAGWPAERLAGVDLIPTRLAAARLSCPDVDIRLSESSSIPFPDDSVDVATAATVFSSIMDPTVRRALFAEMERVVRPGGLLLIYDFVIRKPTNSSVVRMPLRGLAELGRPPDGSIRLSPLLHAVALAAALHPRLADWAMRIAPRTHRLSYWCKPLLDSALVA